MVGQWFPKIARLEPDGRWAHFPFHHLAEFYADFGTYDVTLKAPKSFVARRDGARRRDRATRATRHIERHVQRDVHDFAWTAYDQFQERSENDRRRARARPLSARLRRTRHERELATLRFGIPHFSERYGKYPYDILTLVHPPDGAAEAGGMEYPTLITTGGPVVTARPGVASLELVTIHEFGHQWFYGMLASDEVTLAVPRRGYQQLRRARGHAAWRGQGNVVDLFGLESATRSSTARGRGARVHDAPVAQPAFDFPTGGHYGGLVYARTAAHLRDGRPRLRRGAGARAIGRYARRSRFRHPTPEDLLASYEEVLGPAVRAMLEDALFHRGWVDFRDRRHPLAQGDPRRSASSTETASARSSRSRPQPR